MRVAIAGYGLEGQASLKYWLAQGAEVTVVDENESTTEKIPDGVGFIGGEGVFSQLNGFDMVVRTASLSPDKIQTDGKVWSATNEFFLKCPAPIIGVTGTKGKGTTSSLITSILRAAGKTTHLVGNIGTPALEVLPEITADHLVVFEMSSFQLWDIEKSPHVAVILGIEPDHLNVHRDMTDYVQAKANIAKFQTENDVLVFNKNNHYTRQIADTAPSGTKLGYPFELGGLVEQIKLPGPHNIENASAAVAAVQEYVQDEQVIGLGLATFEGLPHRIKFVRKVGEVEFYDDSYSSAPAATIAAIKSFTSNKIVIVGGYDKGADFSELAECVAKDTTVKKLVLIGTTRHKIAEVLMAHGIDTSRFEVQETTDFQQIITRAYQLAAPSDVVVLSPGCASFDMFKNFTQRGEMFIEYVGKL